MNEMQISEKLGWLGNSLFAGRNNLAKTLSRLKEIGAKAGENLGLHRKFMQLLEQIAVDRDKEVDLINEIENLEKRHREMKERHLLRRAGDSAAPKAPTQDLTPAGLEEERPERLGLWTLWGLLIFFSLKGINHKNQDLTVD